MFEVASEAAPIITSMTGDSLDYRFFRFSSDTKTGKPKQAGFSS